MELNKLTVRQLNMYVKSLLEGDVNLSAITLVGEISNFKNHYSSGHLYFVLKDSEASVRVVMFKANAKLVNFVPNDGMMVVLRGYVSLYARDGQYQFYAESMLPFGIGDIAMEFERVKAKLEAEGLFSAERKKSLPKFPQKVGIITSETGAALNDIINVSARRFPICDLILFPSLVQGITAPKSLISALDKAYKREDLDLIIIGRGGGSAEDLSCFNDEQLARKIAEAPIPIVSAVGHEIDFTICDYVADLRAPTPSAAAEIAFPASDDILRNIFVLKQKIRSDALNIITNSNARVELILNKRAFKNPEQLFTPFELRLDKLIFRLDNGYKFKVHQSFSAFDHLSSRLEALGPNKTFKRGFAIASWDGKILKNVNQIKVGDKINVKLSDGSFDCTVENILED